MISMLALSLLAVAPAGSSLERLGDELRGQILKSGAEPPVALVLEAASPALGRALSTVVAAKLAEAKLAPMVVEPGIDAEARAVERGARTMVRLMVALEGQKTVARGDTYGVWQNFWAGRSQSRGVRGAGLVVTLESDAQMLNLAGAALPSPLMASVLEVKATVLAKLAGLPAALSVGDVDGDGKVEIAVIVDETLSVFSADGRLLSKYDLSLGPAALLPTRDVYGLVAVATGPSRIVAWSAKRARAEILTWSNGALKGSSVFADSVPLDGLVVRIEAGVNRLASEALWAGRAVSLGAQGPQAIAGRGALTLFIGADGSASLGRGAVPAAKVTGVGPGSTLADLDGDGTAEVVCSSNRTAGEDQIFVLSLAAFDTMAARGASLLEASTAFKSPLPRGRAWAAVAADLDGTRGDEVVLATALPDGTGELLVLHRETP